LIIVKLADARLSAPKPIVMKTFKENGTHKAVEYKGKIGLFLKGFTIEDLTFEDELLYTIPLAHEDDLESIFDNIEETTRILLAEARGE
jgi:hypothetical protein